MKTTICCWLALTVSAAWAQTGPIWPCEVGGAPTCWTDGTNAADLKPGVVALLWRAVEPERILAVTTAPTDAKSALKTTFPIATLFFVNAKDATAWLTKQAIEPKRLIAILPYQPLAISAATATETRTVEVEVITQTWTVRSP